MIDTSCKVISGKQFKQDCKLVKLFAMASRSSDADEPEGVDEGVATDEESEYVRSRKTADFTISFVTIRRTLSVKYSYVGKLE